MFGNYIVYIFKVCDHKGFTHIDSDDLFLDVRCSCVLANSTLLLGCVVRSNNETPNHAYD